ncbi:MAG TPA: L,D-transpeptidase family protein [Gaiellaceae bacterium]|nr:L,D-transpeptidase family protein [Gaiellaceae bacterium]
MKRLHAVVLFVLGFAAAGAFSGAVIADVTTSTGVSTAATTAPVTTTAPAGTTTATTTTTTSGPRTTVPAGVRVAGVRVGGLSPAVAVAAVQSAFRRPLPVGIDRGTVLLDPAKVASAYAATAVARARIATPGTNVQLVVAVNGAPLRAWIASLRKRIARAPVNAIVKVRDGHPYLTKARPGRALSTAGLAEKIVAALKANTRLPIRLRTAPIAATISVSDSTETIVISRSINRLYLYDRAKLVRTFPVATGQSVYPTPQGVWHIVVMEKNPWWYPPVQDAWAKGLKPVPPGPLNPLGTRWMGLNSPGIGIHGTDEPTSIGYSESHGCIRMQVPAAEWLFAHVGVGTTVYIL